ncbi:MAG: FAD-binding oxidoreductase [Geminicoccaceae bacterium]
MHELVAALQRELGDGVVLAGAAVPERNRQDWSGLPATAPLAVVRARTTADVATTLRLCHAAGVSVAPQGGLTGLCGGARAGAGEVALSLERVTGVEEIDPATATMTVRAGTPLELVQQAAADAGFFFALDLGARGSCAIGGNVATNAGGNRVIRYGMTRDMVLGIEAVLPDGTVLTALNKLIKNNAGYDLKQLFIGSEGTLGVVTRVVLRLYPQPASIAAGFCGLPDYAAVLRLLQEARRQLGAGLSAFEGMWHEFYDCMTTKATGVRPPLAGRHPLYVLLEAHGTDAADSERFEAFLGRMLEEGVIADAAVAQTTAQVKAFWAVRDAVAEYSTMIGPMTNFDIGLVTDRMHLVVEELRARIAARWPDAIGHYYGHIGDGNIHVNVHIPGADPQPKGEVEALVFGVVRDHGGSVSAEHGIGVTKLKWIGYSRSPEELALMRTIKQAVDPRGILNPGKVVAG